MKLDKRDVLLRVATLFIIAFGLPKLVFIMQADERRDCAHVTLQSPLPIEKVYTKRVVLITNRIGIDHTSFDASLIEGYYKKLEQRYGSVAINKIMLPFSTEQDAMFAKKLGSLHFLPRSISLVSGKPQELFSQAAFADCDALCVAIQDTGVRTDGYVSVLYEALTSAHALQKELVIIDHPNPLGGTMEGFCSTSQDITDEALFLAKIPLRHGMTLGELARYMNNALFSKPAHLTIIPLEDYNRFAPYDTRVFKPMFSRNIASLQACRGYTFLGLLGEVRPFDVAIGTSKAFQALLLPASLTLSPAAWQGYRALLKKHAIESREWRYFSKRKKEWLVGVRFFMPDNQTFSSLELVVETLLFFKQMGVKMTPTPMVDTVIGSSLVRRMIEGSQQADKVVPMMQTANQHFLQKAFSAYLYKPIPREYKA